MANKDKKNITSFEKNNKAAEKWDVAECKLSFERIVDLAIETKVWLSMQSIVLYNGIIPYSTFYYLLEKFPVLDSYKRQLNDIIIERINNGALLGDFVPAPSIWRMKQLGEKDKQEIDNNHNFKKPPKIEFFED